MPDADLTGANLTDATVGGGNINSVRWPDLTGARWRYPPPPGGWVVDSDTGQLKRAGR